jgi:hypothetical protein
MWFPSHFGVCEIFLSQGKRDEWSASRSGRFTPTERAPGTHWIGGWVGPRAILETAVTRKIPSPRRKSNPRTPIVHPRRLYRVERYVGREWWIGNYAVGSSGDVFYGIIQQFDDAEENHETSRDSLYTNWDSNSDCNSVPSARQFFKPFRAVNEITPWETPFSSE